MIVLPDPSTPIVGTKKLLVSADGYYCEFNSLRASGIIIADPAASTVDIIVMVPPEGISKGYTAPPVDVITLVLSWLFDTVIITMEHISIVRMHNVNNMCTKRFYQDSYSTISSKCRYSCNDGTLRRRCSRRRILDDNLGHYLAIASNCRWY